MNILAATGWTVVWMIMSVWMGVLIGQDSIVLGMICGTIITIALKMTPKAIRSIYKNIKEKSTREERLQKCAIQFFQKCTSLHLDLNKEYGIEKARLLMKEVLTSHDVDIPEKYHDLYLTNEAIKSYYQQGQSLRNEHRAERKRKEDLRRVTPQAADKKLYSNAVILSQKFGREKRITMIQQMIDPIEDRIRSIEAKQLAAQQAMFQVGAIISQSAAQTKTKDWAMIGGAVSAVAGPVAGLLAASSAITENAAIEAQNQKNREAVNRIAADFVAKGMSIAPTEDVASLKEQKKPLEKLKNAQMGKVVFESNKHPIEELYNALEIEVKAVPSANSVKVSGTVRYKETLTNLPDDVQTTIDGSLLAKVYYSGNLLGVCYLPLPVFGVETGNNDSHKIQGYCDEYMINDQEYKIEISPINLWLMEV